MTKKILVTGGAGFIGSHIVDRLVAEGNAVSVLDNLSTGRKENVNPKAVFYDTRTHQDMNEILEKESPEYIIHEAAQVSVERSVEFPEIDAEDNILLSIELMQAAVEKGVKKFIYASSGGAIYGDPQFFPVTEEHPINPLSPYGISKHTVEHYLEFFQREYGLNYVALRYSNVYGPRQDPEGEAGVVSIFMDRMLKDRVAYIYGDGKQTRDFVYVQDVVDANLKAMEKCKPGAYNIGTGVETSVNDMHKLISKLTGNLQKPVHKEGKKGEVKRIALDVSKAHAELQWSPKHTIEHGLKDTLKWFQAANKKKQQQ